jgi:hypothetical protein
MDAPWAEEAGSKVHAGFETGGQSVSATADLMAARAIFRTGKAIEPCLKQAF